MLTAVLVCAGRCPGVPAGALMVVAVSGVDYGKNRGAEKEKESEIQKGAECGEGKGISCNFVSGAGNES